METPQPDGTGGRYARQERVQGIGPDGQERLQQARVLIVGCGYVGLPLGSELDKK